MAITEVIISNIFFCKFCIKTYNLFFCWKLGRLLEQEFIKRGKLCMRIIALKHYVFIHVLLTLALQLSFFFSSFFFLNHRHIVKVKSVLLKTEQ